MMIPCINLLPWRIYRQQQHSRQLRKLFALALVITMLIFSCIHITLRREITRQYLVNQHILQKNASLNPLMNNINIILNQKKNWNKTIMTLEELHMQRISAIFIFKTLADIMPVGAYIESIHYDNNNISMTGYAKNNTTIATIVSCLKKYPAFSRITLNGVMMNRNDLLTHQFNITWVITPQLISPATPANISARGTQYAS